MANMEILVLLVAVASAQDLSSCSKYCDTLLSGIKVRWRSDCDCSLNLLAHQLNDTSIYYKPATHHTKPETARFESQFLILNPTTKQRSKNSTVHNNSIIKEARKLPQLTKVKPEPYVPTTQMSLISLKQSPNDGNVSYFDVDFNIVNEIRNNVKYSPNYYGLLERNLTECVELHILKFIRNCNSTDVPNNVTYEIDDDIDYTDEELKREIDNKCREIADIVDKSIKEIKEKWLKSKPLTRENNEEKFKSLIEYEPQTKLNTNIQTNTTHSGSNPNIDLNRLTNIESNTATSQLTQKNVTNYYTNTEMDIPSTTYSQTPVNHLIFSETKYVSTQSSPTRESNYYTNAQTNIISVQPNETNELNKLANTENSTFNHSSTSLKNSRPTDSFFNKLQDESLDLKTLNPSDVSLNSSIEDVTDHSNILMNRYLNNKVFMLLPAEYISKIPETKQRNPFLPLSLEKLPLPEVIENQTTTQVYSEETTAETVTLDADSIDNLKNDQMLEQPELKPRLIMKNFTVDDKLTIPDDNNVQHNYNKVFSNRDWDMNKTRPTIEEEEVPVIRIISREYPNGTVFSDINGTELLPNNDFRQDQNTLNLRMKNVEVNNSTQYSEKIYEFVILLSNDSHIEEEKDKTSAPNDIITGRLYFLYKSQQMPAHFVQDPDGTFKIGIDTIRYCEKFAKYDTNVLSTLCKCVQANDCTEKSNL